jgi:hypothetical protein
MSVEYTEVIVAPTLMLTTITASSDGRATDRCGRI